MALTKKVGKPPRAIAEELVKALAASDVVASAEIAGPGFVNLRLHPRGRSTTSSREILARGQGVRAGAGGDRGARSTSSS